LKIGQNYYFSSFINKPFGAYACVFAALAGEGLLLTTLFTTYSHSLHFLNTVFVADLPVVGALRFIDPDLSMSHLICLLLAVFSIAVPIFILHLIKQEKLFQNFSEWSSYPGNKVLMALLGFLFLLVVGIEITAFYSMIASKTQAASGGFIIAPPPSGFEAYLQDNTLLGVLISVVVVTVNCVLAYASVWAFDNLKKTKGE